MYQTSKTIEQVVAAIQALDLDPIKFKLMDREEGQGWSREYVDRMEVAYKRFLTLLVRFPDETIAPTKDIDKFWHGHILDTLKYAEDCQNVFGYFLHHFPYFGMVGEEDAANQRVAADKMHSIYEREYGEQIPSGAAWCYAAKPVTKDANAWCYAAKPTVEAEAAWCYAAKPVTKEANAWCYAAKPTVEAEAAWCYAAKPVAKEANAWCYAAKPMLKSDNAWCYATVSAQGRPDVSVRPSLPPTSLS